MNFKKMINEEEEKLCKDCMYFEKQSNDTGIKECEYWTDNTKNKNVGPRTIVSYVSEDDTCPHFLIRR